MITSPAAPAGQSEAAASASGSAAQLALNLCHRVFCATVKSKNPYRHSTCSPAPLLHFCSVCCLFDGPTGQTHTDSASDYDSVHFVSNAVVIKSTEKLQVGAFFCVQFSRQGTKPHFQLCCEFNCLHYNWADKVDTEQHESQI